MSQLRATDAGRLRASNRNSRGATSGGDDSAETAAPKRDAEPGGGADLLEFVAILRRNFRMIILATCLTTGVAIGYLAVTPKLYTSTVSILFDASPRAPIGSDPGSQPASSPDATLVESQVKLLASDTVLRRVVAEEGLVNDPEFGPSPPGLRARLLTALGLGGKSATPSSAAVVDQAVGTLAHNLEVKRSERTYVIDVDVSARDPGKAARLANAVARSYFEDEQAAKGEVVARDSKWLDMRLNVLQGRVANAETKVTNFKSANGINDANGKNISEQELSDLATEMTRARAQTAQAQARNDQIRKINAAGRLPDGTSDALKSSTLDRLRAQYAEAIRQEANARTTLGARHPALIAIEAQASDTQRLIAQELRRIAEAASNDYQIARADEDEIARRLAASRKESDAKNEALIELRDLERNADAARTIYEQFLRARETVNDVASNGPRARVIAPAVPPLAPSSPKKALVLALALFTGAFFGTAGALVRDAMGGERKPAADEPGEEILAAVPRIAYRSQRSALGRVKSWAMRTRAEEMEAARKSLFKEVTQHPASPFSASIAKLWEALAPEQWSLDKRRVWTVLVTSITAGVGKTTIATNLARLAADRGARTLLIEANPRNPQLAHMIDPDAKPGLINVGGVERVIYELPCQGAGSLHFVPIMASEPRIVRRLSGRLGSARIDGIDGHFDFVVIDGPTSGDAAELRKLAATADRIALAVTAHERVNVNAFVEQFQISRDQVGPGMLAIVEDRPEAA